MNEPKYKLVGVTRDLTCIEDLTSEPDFIELQMDRADHPTKQLQNYSGKIPLIISWSSSEAGVAEQRLNEKVILEALEYEFVEYIDFDIDILENFDSIIDDIDSTDSHLIVSCYYSDETPPEDELLSQIRACADMGEVTKIVPYANNRVDALNFLKALNSASMSGHSVAGYCRGTAGKYTRIISVLHGSKYCYGVIDPAIGNENDSEIDLDHLYEMLDTVISGADDVELMDILKGKFS